MEFPIFSFILSLFSVIARNDTISINSSTTNSHTNSSAQHIILTVVRPSTVPNIIATTMAPPEPQPLDLRILCPDQVNSSDLTLLYMRYHNQTKKCYTVPSEGPCGNNMAYYAEDDLFGACGCKTDNRLLIFNKKRNECFYIFQRAYCSKLQWLDIKRNGTPICTLNPCATFIHGHGSQKDLVRFQGRCVEVGKPFSGCSSGEIVGFEMYKRIPNCVNALQISPKAFGIPSTPCSIGSVMAIDGRCNPPFDFD